MKALRKSQQNQDKVQNSDHFRLRPGHYASPNPMFDSTEVQKPFCISNVNILFWEEAEHHDQAIFCYIPFKIGFLAYLKNATVYFCWSQ